MRAKRLRGTLFALPCVVLAVDAAESSGWCIAIHGTHWQSGEHHMLVDRDKAAEVCRWAVELARGNGNLPAVLVYERPFHGSLQGQWIGAWKLAWAEAGGVRTRTVGVFPATWRARVLGGRWASAPRDKVRPYEQQVARESAARDVGEDEAPAICIARWASYALEVEAKLPSSKRRGKGAA